MPSLKLRALVGATLVIVASAASDGRAQSITSGLLGNPQIAPLGLEPLWASFVRVDPARGRVASLQVGHGLVVAHTDQGVVQAIHAESGRTLWSVPVGDPNYPTMPPSFNDKFVAVTNGSTLYLLDRANGATMWSQRLSTSPSAGSAMNDDRVWVPLDTGLIEAYLLERGEGRELYDSIPKRYTGADGAIVAPNVIGKRCNWTISEGYVYSSEETFKDLFQFRFKTDDKVSTGTATIGPYLFCASRRGTIYCLDDKLGNEVWRYSIGASVSHPLIAVDGNLLVINELGNMVRLDPVLGVPKWFTRGVKRFLAASTDRVYVLDMFDRLTVIDLATGTMLGATPTSGFNLPCYNQASDRVYLASSSGLLQCLRESKQVQPVMHTREAPKAVPADPNAAPADPNAAPDPNAPAAPAAGNPFGTP